VAKIWKKNLFFLSGLVFKVCSFCARRQYKKIQLLVSSLSLKKAELMYSSYLLGTYLLNEK